ncbi:DUF817 family protein, partial [Neisseria sicca]|uniref:DUF817 family protein n=1 Tax=Neisseria sicca TaxID=490 RepID=UPI0034D95830
MSPYHLLLIFPLSLHPPILYFNLQTSHQLKSITLFHLLPFPFHSFNTSPHIHSSTYPHHPYTKIPPLPLFAPFIYPA